MKNESYLRYGSVLLLSAALSSCGGGGSNSSATITPAVGPVGASPKGVIPIAQAIQTSSNLPGCDSSTEGKVYLVLSNMQLQLCQSGQWAALDLKGEKGDTGPAGSGDNGAVVDYDYITYDFNADSTSTKYYRGGPNGTLLRTCYNKSDSSSVLTNGVVSGSHYKSTSWGDAGCGSYYVEYTLCNAGYTRSGASCVASVVPTEPPPGACTFTQEKDADGSCRELTFSEITGNLCGTYKMPVRITSAVHYVTCDVSFLARVIIEPGSEIRFDDEWTWNSGAGVQALGTSGSPIQFKPSAGNPVGRWKQINFSVNTPPIVSPKYQLQLAFNQFVYTSFANTVTYGLSGTRVSFQNAFIDRATFSNIVSPIKLEKSVMWNSSLTGISYMNVANSEVFRNTGLNSATMTIGDGVIALWNSPITMSVSAYSKPTFVAFNTPATLTCSSMETAYVYGNRPTVALNAGCAGANSGGNALGGGFPTTPAIFNMGSSSLIGTKGQQVVFGRILGATGADFMVNPLIHWKASSTFDGATNVYGTEWDSGEYPQVTLDQVEQYRICPQTVNGGSFLGNACVNVIADNP